MKLRAPHLFPFGYRMQEACYVHSVCPNLHETLGLKVEEYLQISLRIVIILNKKNIIAGNGWECGNNLAMPIN